MNPVRDGTAIALVVAGWPLYDLVSAGGMNAETALLRGAVVAAACVYGVTLITRLIVRYEADAEAARRKRLDQLFSDMEGAVSAGTLADPGAGAPQTTPPAPSPPGPSSA